MMQQYVAIHQKVGVLDLSNRCKVEFRGTDARSFLHHLTSQDIKNLSVGTMSYALLLDAKARILADFFIWSLSDSLIAETEPFLRQKVLDRFSASLITEQVQIKDCSDDFRLIDVQGPLAWSLLDHLGSLEPFGAIVGKRASDHYALLIPNASHKNFYSHLMKIGQPLGLVAIDPDVEEIIRIEEGIPHYGKDFSEENLPPEARLFRAISYNKGCYPGQEIVARLKTYGGIRRQLVGLKIHDQEVPLEDAKIFDSQTQVGWITSSCFSPKWQGPLAMGYVQRSYAEQGRKLTVISGDCQFHAEVIELPELPLKDLEG